MTPEVRDLWEKCAEVESRSLTNMFEVLVRAHAKKLKLEPAPPQDDAPRKRASPNKSKS